MVWLVLGNKGRMRAPSYQQNSSIAGLVRDVVSYHQFSQQTLRFALYQTKHVFNANKKYTFYYYTLFIRNGSLNTELLKRE